MGSMHRGRRPTVPAMSDECIIVKGHGGHDLSRRPPSSRRRPERSSSPEELGGAEVHTPGNRASPIISRRGRPRACVGPRHRWPTWARDGRALDVREPTEPLYPAEELHGVISARTSASRTTCAIDRAHRGRKRARTNSSRITHHTGHRIRAHLGYPVGIVANNGILFSESALKGAHFIELCSQRNIPLVFLQNITGFMVGKKYETVASPRTERRCDGGRVQPGAQVTVVIGGSFGAGTTACADAHSLPASSGCGPTPHLGDGRGTGGVGARHGEARRASRRRRYWSREQSRSSSAPSSSSTSTRDIPTTHGRLWDDGVIAPRTPVARSRSPSRLAQRTIEETRFGVFRM